MHDRTDDEWTMFFQGAGDAPTPPPELRKELREATSRVVRWRNIRRKAAGYAMWAACFLAGWFFRGNWMPPKGGDAPQQVVRADPPKQKEGSPPANVEPSREVEPAGELELRGRLTKSAPEKANLLREAGRQYLAQGSDPAEALRCYTEAMKQPGAAATNNNDDDWLWQALQRARNKEQARVSNDG